MDTGLTIAVILAMIALGTFLIHRLNDQRAERIAQRQHGRRGANSPARPQPGIAPPPAVRTRRDHRDGGRGRLRPRRKANRAATGRRT
ncbi:hypothetical protein [Streptomyces formicae]